MARKKIKKHLPAGEVGYGFGFNGVNQYVSVPDNAAWGFGTNAFSIDLWANFSANSGTYALLANDEGGGSTSKWIFWLNGTTLQLHVNSPTNGAFYIGSASFTPTLCQWYHLALIRNGDSFLFYNDGILVSSNTSPVIIPTPNAPLTIGQAEGAFNLSGLLDDVRIYDRALNYSEIQAIYRAGTNGMCAASPLMFSGPPCCNESNGVVLNACLRSSQSYRIQANTNLGSTNWVVPHKLHRRQRPGVLLHKPCGNQSSATVLSDCIPVKRAEEFRWMVDVHGELIIRV